MATSILNLSSYSLLPCEEISNFSSPRHPTRLRVSHKNFCKRSTTKAAADNRETLDHLQRVNQKQTQPNRVAPIAPPTGKKRHLQPTLLPINCSNHELLTGSWGRFPTARTVQQMMDTMEGTMEDPLAYSGSWPSLSGRERGGYGRGRTPWAIKEREKDFKMRFDMPGMTKGDVKVWLEENMLVVKAEKVKKKQEGQVTADDEEWPATSFGKYSSRIALPENIEFEKIKAEVKDGVLYITIPKATISKIVEIDVQ